jgi:hypothetical protein
LPNAVGQLASLLISGLEARQKTTALVSSIFAVDELL